VNTFTDKISQNITWWSTNILNEMNKFAIDAKAFQPGYKKTYIDSTATNPSSTDELTGDDEITDIDDEFDINEYDESQQMSMSASISDVKRVYEEQAEHAWAEALRQQYEELWAFNLLKWDTYKTMFKRMKLFFFRNEIKDNVKKEELEKYQTNGVDMSRSELTAAADRHERMFNDTDWNKNAKITRSVVQVNDSKIDDLCKEYLNSSTWMTDKEFEDRFNTIVSANKTIRRGLWKGMNHTASNILLKLRAERAEQTMKEWLLMAVEKYATNSDAAEYQKTVKDHVTTYITLTQRALSPNLQKALTAPW
jgi:hypothetical protein